MINTIIKKVKALKKRNNKDLKGFRTLFFIDPEFNITFIFIRPFKLSEEFIYFYKLYVTQIKDYLINLK